MTTNQIKLIIKTIRPSFLLLTPICVLLGLSTAIATGSPINSIDFLLILLGAMSAHISVNTLNEYYDFKTGLDFNTVKTPFSGGSGALPTAPELAIKVLIVGIVSLAITSIIGLYFLAKFGFTLLPIGLIGIILIMTYTQWVNRLPLTCLISPGLGFGVLMVVGTHIVLTGFHAVLPWLVSLIPFFLINNLLLLNQYPDIEADKSVGRKTFPISYGLQKSNLIFVVFAIATVLSIIYLVAQQYITWISLLALLPLTLSFYAYVGANKHKSRIQQYPKFMAANVISALLTPLVLGVSILINYI